MSTNTADKRIRLCIVMGAHWEAQMGGAQYQVRCLLEQLRHNADIEIFYLAHLTPKVLKRGSYTIVPIGFVPNALGKRLGRAIFLPDLPSLYRALRRITPHVVYQRALQSYTGVCAYYCARHDAKLIFHAAHEDDVQPQTYASWRPGAVVNRIERRIAEYGLKRADAIVVQTEDQARLLREHYGRSTNCVVRNFHPAPERPLANRSRAMLRRITWVANFKPMKNPEIFVDLAESFVDRTDVEFVMVGRPGPVGRYKRLHDRIRGLPNLSYLGELPVERVEELLEESDIFVNTSKAEGFPNTFIQAWLRGVPVISCCVDPDRCLSEGGGGIVTHGAAGLKAAVAQLLDDPERLRMLRDSARNYALANHTPSQAHTLLNLVYSMGSQLTGTDRPELTGEGGVLIGGAEK
jgi:glycosyltransferase involved in cell wall biosynthesis